MDFIFGCWSGPEAAVDCREAVERMRGFFDRERVPAEVFPLSPRLAVGVASLVTPAADFPDRLTRAGSVIAVGDVALFDEGGSGNSPSEPSEPPAPEATRHLLRLATAVRDDSRLARLDGDFAAAVLDEATQTLHLVRDHMGQIPLHYARHSTACAFSTLVRPLLAVPWVPAVYDEIALATYLVTLAPGIERTCFSAIKAVAPASRVSVRADGSLAHSRYWVPHPSPGMGAVKSREEAGEAVREKLVRAVKGRLSRGGKSAVMLSGGLDSSTVAGIACALVAGQPVEAVSSVLPDGYQGPSSDERVYIDAMAARHPNLHVTCVTAEDADPLDGRTFSSTWIGAPLADNFHYVTRRLMSEAAARGATTVMTGEGGDHCVSLRAGGTILAEALVTLDPALFRSELHRLQGAYGLSTAQVLRYRLLPALLPHGVRTAWHRLRHEPWYAGLAITPRMAENEELLAELAAAGIEPVPRMYRRFSHDERAVLRVNDLRGTSILNVAGGALRPAVRVRHPLLDRELIETCLAVPARFKVATGEDRSLIRAAATPFLPNMLRTRRDKGMFAPGFAHQLRKVKEQLRADLQQAAKNDLFCRLVDIRKVESSLARLDGAPRQAFEHEMLSRVLVPLNLAHFTGTGQTC